MADNLNGIYNEISYQLKKDLQPTLNNIASLLVEDAKNQVDVEVYSVYIPKIYNRSRQLKNGITKSSVKDNGKSLEVNIYVDDDIVKSHHFNNEKYSLESYAEIVETGKGYDFDYSYEYNQPRAFMKRTLEVNINDILKKISIKS